MVWGAGVETTVREPFSAYLKSDDEASRDARYHDAYVWRAYDIGSIVSEHDQGEKLIQTWVFLSRKRGYRFKGYRAIECGLYPGNCNRG